MSNKILHRDETGAGDDIIKIITDLVKQGSNITITPGTDADGIPYVTISGLADDGKLLTDATDTVRKFLIDSLLSGDNISFELVDSGGGKKVRISTSFVGMPEGTVNNSSLHYNSTTGIFEELVSVLLSTGKVRVEYDSTHYIEFSQTSSQGKLTIQNNVSRAEFTLVNSQSGTNYFRLLSGSTVMFGFDSAGRILSQGLTADSLVISDSLKRMVSLANPATDKILAFESGVLVWVDKPSGGVTLPINESDVTGLVTDLSDLASDIAALVSALAGKSDTTHNHNLNDLTEKSYLSLTDKPDIPNSRLSFLPLDHSFSNLYVYAFGSPEPLAPPITDFVLIGDYTETGTTGFKNTLEADKRYYFECRLIIPRPVDSYTEFQLKMNCPTTWGVTLWSVKNTTIPMLYPDITVYPSSDPTRIRKFEKNTVYSYFLEEDSGILFCDIMIIGTIDTTGTDGVITFESRNISREQADGTDIFIIDLGSYMRSIECSIN